MKRLLLLPCSLLLSIIAFANTITVGNIEELKKANDVAKPGDIIILKNGEWKDVIIKLNCNGTKEQPVIFQAETTGKVIINGNSQLKFGGNYITVDGFYFLNGYAGDDAVVDFRIDKKQLANNCRLTNTAINNFNNPKRMQENYWVSLYGKNNRIDHCSFLNKKNMGVLMAVILDDERSRENFHSIDHNYFGVRLPLASNSGEIIRIGVSQHCKFNSNTQVVDNFFEHCDGETEIVSVKSCMNVVRNNLFKECQGGVVLRHGNYNTVENNIFLGNGKEGTGGVRIINKGQWVINNLFYKCRGVGFRSPLSIMNGVPNSPDFRYVAVTDAVISNNSFVACTPISLCEGSDTERTVVPAHVEFINNVFWNAENETIYNAYDDISSIHFSGNLVKQSSEPLANGFTIKELPIRNQNNIYYPGSLIKYQPNDSLSAIAATRLTDKLSTSAGFGDNEKIMAIENNAYQSCGAKWFSNKVDRKKTIVINCATAKDIALQIKNAVSPVLLNLTGTSYIFNEPITINCNVILSSKNKQVNFSSTGTQLPYVFEIKAGNILWLSMLNVNAENLHADALVSSDLNGGVDHSNFSIVNSKFTNLSGTFFNSVKYTVFDSIIVNNSSFTHIKGTIFDFNNETDKKGYYTVEKLSIDNSTFDNNQGQLLGMLRGGNDESTMGPLLTFRHNKISNSTAEVSLIKLNGTQRSFIQFNTFIGANPGKVVLEFEDAVRAVHTYGFNTFTRSGDVITNKFVTSFKNIVQP